MGNVTISDSFIYIKDGEVWVKNLKVARYKQAHRLEIHDENRDKKLLLTKKQIEKIGKNLQDAGITCIPLSIFVKNNKIKIKIGVAKGQEII
jgi:SsrA-binding protein